MPLIHCNSAECEKEEKECNAQRLLVTNSLMVTTLSCVLILPESYAEQSPGPPAHVPQMTRAMASMRLKRFWEN